MVGVYDEMSERSYPGLSRRDFPATLASRIACASVMENEGFLVYEFEWWHFDYGDWRKYPILNLTFEQLTSTLATKEIAAILDPEADNRFSEISTRQSGHVSFLWRHRICMKRKNLDRAFFFPGYAGIRRYFCASHPLFAQSSDTLEQRIKKVMDRPEFAHSRFGLEFITADTGEVVYKLNAPQLFVPGSTTKLLSEGTMLEILGAAIIAFTQKFIAPGRSERTGRCKVT